MPVGITTLKNGGKAPKVSRRSVCAEGNVGAKIALKFLATIADYTQEVS
jgi:hypothetical protein